MEIIYQLVESGLLVGNWAEQAGFCSYWLYMAQFANAKEIVIRQGLMNPVNEINSPTTAL